VANFKSKPRTTRKTRNSGLFFVLPAIDFKLLFVFLILAHERRHLIHFNVTEHPSAAWTAAELLQAFPWDTSPVTSD